MGRITPVVNYIRRVLIEEVYGRLSKTFHSHTRVRWALTRLAKALCSPIRRAGQTAPMSRPTTFRLRFVPLTPTLGSYTLV
jgi:hypothetical protein